MSVSDTMHRLARVMFEDAWRARLSQAKEATLTAQGKLDGIEKQIDQLLVRIVEASNQSVVAAYEKTIAQLERTKLLAEEELISIGKPRYTLEESFELAFEFLSKPWSIWKNHGLEWKRTVLRLAFLEHVPFCRNQGL